MTVTICTVLTPMHKRLMGLNYNLINSLNPDVSVNWNVVFNRKLHLSSAKRFQIMKTIRLRLGKPKGWPNTAEEKEEADAYLQQELDAASDPGAVRDYIPEANVYKGYKPKQLTRECEQIFGRKIDRIEKKIAKYLGSYLHSAGLNTALRHSKTRYSIIIDPDFYVIQKNWIKTILKKMEDEDLAVFGAPWNPRWYQKFRNFPCTHLMVIDHEKLRFQPDLLAPDLISGGFKYISPTIAELSNVLRAKVSKREKARAIKKFLMKAHRVPFEDRRQRDTIGASRDTGYRLLERHRNGDEINHAMLTPVFDPEIEGFEPKMVFPLQRAGIVEKIYRPELRYMPPPDAYSRTGFYERGYPNFRALNWEEFLFEDKPFAFHVRGEMHRVRSLCVDIYPAWLGLCAILQAQGMPSLPDLAPLKTEIAELAA